MGGEFGMLAALIIGSVAGAIVGKLLIERCDHAVEVARQRVEGQHERADLRAQEMIRARRPERGQRLEIASIDELEHRWRIGEVPDLALA